MPDIPGNPISFRALFSGRGYGPSLAADVRRTLSEIDLIVGEDATSGRQFLVYGRAALARDVGGGRTALLGTLKIGLDPETDELERLLAIVQEVKGHHDYQGDLPEPGPAILRVILPDAALYAPTADQDPHLAGSRAWENAALQSALDALRRRGIPRPVAFVLVEDNEAARRHREGVVEELRRRGLPFHSAGPGGVGYVVTVEQARKILRPFLGGDAQLWFRRPTWPVSYWTVGACRQGFVRMESRPPQDMARTGTTP